MLTKLFEFVEETHAHTDKNTPVTIYAVKMSYLEVYNENIIDLLSFENKGPIEIREDPIKGIILNGLTEVTIGSTADILKQMNLGNIRRTKEPTMANEVSSRSHAVLQLLIEKKNYERNNRSLIETITCAKLSLIDLAGSERAAYTQNTGLRMIEGANINKSLLALGNCINTLSELATKKKGVKRTFVSYRDSKLTRLLKDSLDGNCKTLMIANVSPAYACYEDTLNTLKYANRAKTISTKPFVISNAAFDLLSGDEETAKLKEYIRSFKTTDLNFIIGTLSQEVEALEFELTKFTEQNIKSRANNDEFINLEKEIISHFDSEATLLQQISDQMKMTMREEQIHSTVNLYLESYKKRSMLVKRIQTFCFQGFPKKYLESVYNLHKEKAEIFEAFEKVKRVLRIERSNQKSSSKVEMVPQQIHAINNISVFQTRRLVNDSENQFPTIKKKYRTNDLVENFDQRFIQRPKQAVNMMESRLQSQILADVNKRMPAVDKTFTIKGSSVFRPYDKTNKENTVQPTLANQRAKSEAYSQFVKQLPSVNNSPSVTRQTFNSLAGHRNSNSTSSFNLQKIKKNQIAALNLLKSKYNIS